MIKAIDELSCTNCGFCDDVCPMDVFRRRDGKVYIAYQDDCNHCQQCALVCPVDAIVMTPGMPKKFSRTHRWDLIKAEIYIFIF